MATQVENLAILQDGSFLINMSPDTWVNTRDIAAASPEAIAVPTWTTQSGATKYASRVIFGATGNFCVRFNATGGGSSAAFGDVTNGSGCPINPAGALLNGVQEISVCVAVDGTKVSATFFK